MYSNPPSPGTKRKRTEKEGSTPKKKRKPSFGEGMFRIFKTRLGRACSNPD